MKWMKRLAVLVGTLLLASCGAAEPINHTLWKIEKAGEPTSYLVGTVHFGASDSTLNPLVAQALLQSKTLMTESIMPINAVEAAQPEIVAVMQSTLNPDAAALRRTLGEARYATVRQYFAGNEQLSMLLPVFDHLQPWAVLMYASSAPPAGYDSEHGVDYLLSQAAHKNGIRRMGLEKVEKALQTFKNLPQEKVLSALDISLQHIAETEADTQKLVQLYQQGKTAELIAWANDEEQALKYLPPSDRAFWREWFYDTVLDKRTAGWMPVALAQLPEEETLIAVGLMHLDGKNGMIAQLRAAGYTVTPVQ
ncbi:MAG: TraB/GumN family protein [Neisseria sp.]|nr:TraB/GumN family protein [Neisseria sp.]